MSCKTPKRKLLDDGEPSGKKAKKIKVAVKEEALSEQMQTKYEWTEYHLLSEFQDINIKLAENLIKLFEDGNTIPFIARYRKNCTGDISVEKLRDAKDTYEKILALKAKSQSILKNLEKNGHLTDTLKKAVLSSKTTEELDHVFAPYKPGGKRTLAEKAKALGLEAPAMKLLENMEPVNLSTYVDKTVKELNSLREVEKGVMHIIASVIATNTEVLDHLRKMRKESYFTIETKKMTTKKSTVKTEKKLSKVQRNDDEKKFEVYYDFHSNTNYIKSHQVLAINRGESQKVISVKVVVPDFIYNKLKYFLIGHFVKRGRFNEARNKIMEAAIEDAYVRLIQPLIVREVRAELKAKAEKASLEVFSANLKQILLMKPVKGRPILGIDPGFKNGCKIAVISSTGCVLDTAVIHPFNNNKSEIAVEILKKLIITHSCTLIALGNGTACRETESWISDLIKSNIFTPLDVVYVIVDENGASIYSCSPEAKKEFTDLDPNLISAVSLARRVQDPLAELVKVEPRHLGVGMYQHDLSKKQLNEALDEVVMECVSFVGLDLNTASQCLLRKIAGITDKKATAIIQYREKNGPFLNRLQLKEITGIGPKIFEQCAGFLRVGPTNPNLANEFYKNPKTTKLDCTYIHPESYDVCNKILKKVNLKMSDVGEQDFIAEIEKKKNNLDVIKLSEELKCSKQSIDLIIECLCKPLNFDLRFETDQTPLFKKGLTNILDLKIGSIVTGRVTNVTHFGCFVDIGVGINGLIHSSKQKGIDLKIGDKVEVNVVNVDPPRKRIGLELIQMSCTL